MAAPIAADGSAVPYQMASVLLAGLVPGAPAALVAAHDIEIRAAAPLLRDAVPARRMSVSSHLPRAERVLVPAPRRTLRLANGLAEFVRDRVAAPGTLVFENVHLADHTDRELVGVLLRRLDPARVTVVVCAPDAPDPLPDCLPLHVDVIGGDRSPHVLEGDLPRAEAVEEFFAAGFHHAAAEHGLRLLRSAAPDTSEWWALIHRTAGALAAIERETEARALLDLARRESVEPVGRATVAYATAMLLMRHHEAARRDTDEALSWINEAITISSLLPDPAQRAFHLGFDLNGKALVESRRGRYKEALRLVEEAITLAERDLRPDAHPIHRLVLRVNRGHLSALMSDTGAALADLDAAIAADPGYPDYYIDRGNLLHRLGRDAEAVADYEAAMRLGPPFPEPYYNRAEIRFAQGELEGALADLDYAVELDPTFVDAYANRAGLLAALGEYPRARADARRGLALDPDNAYLLCVLGQAEAASGRGAEARRAFDAAIFHDPALAAAWASRGVLAFEAGDAASAVADLTTAVRLGADASLHFNRAVALRALGREEEARADLFRAAELDPDDEDVRRAITGQPLR